LSSLHRVPQYAAGERRHNHGVANPHRRPDDAPLVTTGVGDGPATEKLTRAPVEHAVAGKMGHKIRRAAGDTDMQGVANHQRCTEAPAEHIAAPQHLAAGGIERTDAADVRAADVE